METIEKFNFYHFQEYAHRRQIGRFHLEFLEGGEVEALKPGVVSDLVDIRVADTLCRFEFAHRQNQIHHFFWHVPERGEINNSSSNFSVKIQVISKFREWFT